MRILLSLLAISFGLCLSPAYADFEAGKLAYDAGDFETAYQEWLPLAERGDGRSQYALSILYRLGQGVKADEQSEFDWLTKAANANSSSAQFNLYVTFGQSTSRRKDTRQSLFWLYTSYYNKNARAEEFVMKIEKQGSDVFDLDTIKMEALEWLKSNHPNPTRD